MDTVARLTAALRERYDVVREIGAGGMATVYLARDIRHNRNVALKVLRPDLGAVLGVERFLSEIQVTANLQHPNLLPLFDSGEAAGQLFYVMPYVEGESLRVRLDREKHLPVDDAIRIAVAIASALEYAHAHGVIHRDLKPENVLLHAGQPVIADFGIALAVSNAGGGRVTQTGISLGTPQYMSPEQATGDRAIDGRTDIYSLGAMTFEMLTGDPPYRASTSQAVIAKVLTERPPSVRASRPTVPDYAELAIARSLEKLPADRFASAREFADALSGRVAMASYATHARTADRIERGPAFTPRWFGVGTVAGAAIVLTASVVAREPVAPVPVLRNVIEPAAGISYATTSGNLLALSPDGRTFAFYGRSSDGQRALYYRSLDAFEATAVPRSENANNPGFSPDGRTLYFRDGVGTAAVIRTHSLAGGIGRTLATRATFATWGDNNVILITRSGTDQRGVWRTDSLSASPTLVAAPDSARGETSYGRPQLLPGSHAALIEISRGTAASVTLGVVDLATGAVTDLGIAGVNPRYAATGHIVFGQVGSGVWAVPFDPARRRVTGAPIEMIENVYVKSGGATEIALSANGTLVYVAGTSGSSTLALLGLDGSVQRLPGLEPLTYRSPRMSPDGKRIAVGIVESADATPTQDIWIYDIASATLSRLTRDGASSRPEWTRDGERVVWRHRAGDQERLMWQPWDKRAEAEVFLPSDADPLKSPIGVSFGGAGPEFAYVTFGLGARSEIGAASIAPPRTPRLILETDANEQQPRLSPDGRWLAYVSNESGTPEVYVRPFPGPGGRIQISAEGGGAPMWSPRGLDLFYYQSGSFHLSRATLSATPELRVTRRDTLIAFSQTNAVVGSWPNYDVVTGGTAILARGSAATVESVVLVVNWFDELRRRVPAVRR